MCGERHLDNGSLFQLVKSKEARRSDGEHYTSEKNILKTIGPLFLDELRAEADRLIGSRSTSAKKLREFRDSLADYAFLDPACGSGNFLIVAYRELRKIETDLIVAIRRKEGTLGDMALDVTFEQKLSIGQFYGIELNWWPARIAETAMFLVDHQANKELAERIGAAPDRLPIKITAHITHNNALAVDWNVVVPVHKGQTFIFGNPPFIGARMMTKQQKEELNTVWGSSVNQLDYVTGWHAQALKLLENRKGRFAFVTTNSISQGDQVARLFGPIFDKHWRIRFAHRTFEWDSEAPGKAAVHCVIIGFDRETSPAPRLWDYSTVRSEPVQVHVDYRINAYLVAGPNVLVAKSRKPLGDIPEARFGSMPNDAGFLVPKPGTPKPIHDSIAMKYVRKFVGAKELLHGIERWCFWITPENLSPRDIEVSAVLKEAVEGVYQHRSNSDRAATKKLATIPYSFGEIRQPVVSYLCVPSLVGESRRFFTASQLSGETIASNLVFTVEDPSGFAFGLISSSMFITWQRAVGGRLKSDLRFSSSLTWNTFPVPELEEKQREAIIKAGEKVLDARALHPERSLAEHYNPLAMAPELLKAHDALDKAVDTAFGAPRKLTSEKQRLELLFKNYEELTS